MKRKISILLVLAMVLGVFSVNVYASEATTAGGFYNIGTKENVVLTPYSGKNLAESVQKDVDADAVEDSWYIHSDRIEVTCTVDSNEGYYGALLVEGNDLPTIDNAIFYIDQVSAKNNQVNFNIYPILPEETMDLTLYISSSLEDFELISIPLSYAVGVNVGEPAYMLGDIDNSGKVTIEDAVTTLQFIAQLSTPTDAEKLAADVDGSGKVTIEDGVMILQYVAQIITDWN